MTNDYKNGTIKSVKKLKNMKQPKAPTIIKQSVTVRKCREWMDNPKTLPEGMRINWISSKHGGYGLEHRQWLDEALDELTPRQRVVVTLINSKEDDAWEAWCKEDTRQSVIRGEKAKKNFHEDFHFTDRVGNGLTVNTYHFSVDVKHGILRRIFNRVIMYDFIDKAEVASLAKSAGYKIA